MATENKKHIPTLRFPEFQNDGEWKRCKLSDVAVRKGKKNTKGIELPVYTNSATSGVISQEDYFDREIVTKENLVNYGIIEPNDFVYNPRVSVTAPVGPISRNKLSRGIMSPLYLIFGFNGGDINFFEHYFKGNSWHNYLRAKANYGARFDRINIGTKEFMDMPIPYPSLAEQKKIADCLSSLDKYIDATKRKLELLKEHKKGLMQRLFPAKGKTTPELRFPEFQNDGEWQIVSLGEITSVGKRRNKSNRSLPIYSINNAEGFVPQSQQFAGMDSEARGYDISAYKIIGKHTFAYNPARINVGSIGYSGELKDILISSLYVCFKTMDNVDDDFLMCFFNSYIFNQAVESNVEGGIRSYLFYENFSRIKIAIPSLYEQKRIASCITSIEDMIKQTNKQICLLETHKNGLLQQLFPKIK